MMITVGDGVGEGVPVRVGVAVGDGARVGSADFRVECGCGFFVELGVALGTGRPASRALRSATMRRRFSCALAKILAGSVPPNTCGKPCSFFMPPQGPLTSSFARWGLGPRGSQDWYS